MQAAGREFTGPGFHPEQRLQSGLNCVADLLWGDTRISRCYGNTAFPCNAASRRPSCARSAAFLRILALKTLEQLVQSPQDADAAQHQHGPTHCGREERCVEGRPFPTVLQ